MMWKPIAELVQRAHSMPVWTAVCPLHGPPIEYGSLDCGCCEDPEDEDVSREHAAQLVGVNEHGYVFWCPADGHYFVAEAPGTRL